MHIELSSLQSQLKEVTSENPYPKDFFRKAASLQSEIQLLAPLVGDSFDEISKAVDAYNTSKIAMSECMRWSNF